MDAVPRHSHVPAVTFDGGPLNCGNGLLLLIRKHIDPLATGQLLEIRSIEPSVDEDLPAWCRLTGNELVSWTKDGEARSFLVSKGRFGGAAAAPPSPPPAASRAGGVTVVAAARPPESDPTPVVPADVPEIAPLSVLGIGSWPRPRWMLQAVQEYLQGRLPDAEFEATAQDAVRLAVNAQLEAGVDVVTDGEQRRDSYASFVGARLDNCQLIPLTDLLPLVNDPEDFAEELKSLDVPADQVRHPAVFGLLGRSRPIAGHELAFARSLTKAPIKVAIPGPYTLARTMWMECISDRAYLSREHLAEDIVRILREEALALLAGGAALVQLDEPVLSEVVYTGAKNTRSFMCGALSEKAAPDRELAFAEGLINRVLDGLPPARTAVHVCRGNWTRDESATLVGDYRPLLPLLSALAAGTLFLELSTPRAGEMEILADLPSRFRIGVGVVNQKLSEIESTGEIVAKAERAIRLFGADRVLLTPDCGFATYAHHPLSSAQVATAKLKAIVEASRQLRRAGG